MDSLNVMPADATGYEVTMEYQKDWGDCLAGCAFHHRWKISAKSEFGKTQISLLGESGD